MKVDSNTTSGETRDPLALELSEPSSKLSSIGFTAPVNLNIAEYRSLVKTLVCGVKTITWGCASCKVKFKWFNA